MRFRLVGIGPEHRVRISRWVTSLTGLRGWAAAGGVAAVLVLTLVGVAAAGVFPGSSPRSAASVLHPDRASSHSTRKSGRAKAASGRQAPGTPASAQAAQKRQAPQKSAPAEATAGGHTAAGQAASSHTASPAGTAGPRPPADAGSAALQTSCTSVAHIGDSTSVDLISPANLPDPAQRLPARYADVGVKHLLIDASGGRSIVEELPGQVNGYLVARAWWHQGYRGCWVFALGTNDAANVAVGSNVGLMGRIKEMMSVAHGEPVLWVNTVTQLNSGSWSEANEQLWDNTLIRALAMYPNMRIFNWAAVAQPGWFLSDGIHYNTLGCAIRAEAIAHALARAFPRYGFSSGPIVR
jgi:hypothetical protein